MCFLQAGRPSYRSFLCLLLVLFRRPDLHHYRLVDRLDYLDHLGSDRLVVGPVQADHFVGGTVHLDQAGLVGGTDLAVVVLAGTVLLAEDNPAEVDLAEEDIAGAPLAEEDRPVVVVGPGIRPAAALEDPVAVGRKRMHPAHADALAWLAASNDDRRSRRYPPFQTDPEMVCSLCEYYPLAMKLRLPWTAIDDHGDWERTLQTQHSLRECLRRIPRAAKPLMNHEAYLKF